VKILAKAMILHPFQEAPQAERRLRSSVASEFDEFLILHFKATNKDRFRSNGLTSKKLASTTELP
jgi:hypothetical protein